MKFTLTECIAILERTPLVIQSLLKNISDVWSRNNEGPDTWSPYDVVGHLIHGEKTDWIPRLEIILSADPDKRFEPFDRFAQFAESKGKSLEQLIDEFQSLRKLNIEKLRLKKLNAADFAKPGLHPQLGTVTLQQLLATWAVHDLNHIAQIVRVMAKRYRREVGPWTEYLKILRQ